MPVLETPHCCWVIPVVFSHACPGSPKARCNLLSPLLMIMSAKSLNHCAMWAGLMLFWYWWLDSTEQETQGYLEEACLAWVTVVSIPQTPSADAPSPSACSTQQYWTTLSAHLNKSSKYGGNWKKPGEMSTSKSTVVSTWSVMSTSPPKKQQQQQPTHTTTTKHTPQTHPTKPALQSFWHMQIIHKWNQNATQNNKGVEQCKDLISFFGGKFHHCTSVYQSHEGWWQQTH